MKALLFCREKVAGLLSRRAETGISIAEAEYVVLDTELTGLDAKQDSIISIGALRMTGARIEMGNALYKLVKPEAEIKGESVVIHGITPSEVAEKPSIDEVISELIDFCGERVIVGHFISLDLRFINREMKRMSRAALSNPCVDTYRLYEWIKENSGSFSRHYERRVEDLNLFSLAREYGIPISEGHNALSDAFITAQLFQRFLTVLPGLGVGTVGDLLRAGRP